MLPHLVFIVLALESDSNVHIFGQELYVCGGVPVWFLEVADIRRVLNFL